MGQLSAVPSLHNWTLLISLLQTRTVTPVQEQGNVTFPEVLSPEAFEVGSGSPQLGEEGTRCGWKGKDKSQTED